MDARYHRGDASIYTERFCPACDHVAPDRSPAGCVVYAAARTGIKIGWREAEQIAAAVLDYADDEYRVRAEFSAGNSGYALDDRYQESLRRRLASEVMEAGMVPVAAPRRVVRDPGPWGWENGYVELVVPVRRIEP